jgi:hypothetical protein
MTHVLIPVEGILRKPMGGQRNEDGFKFYRALSSEYQALLVTEETDRVKVRDWLYKENVHSYTDIILGDFPGNVSDGYWTNLLRYLTRHRGYVLDFVVVNDPESAREVLERGVPVMMYSQPAYGLPEWLPGARKGAEKWSSLVSKVEADRMARFEDKRMETLE